MSSLNVLLATPIFAEYCIYLFILYFYLLLLRKEGNVLCNNALNTLFNLRSYGIGHIVKDNSNRERGNPLPPPNGLLFLISSKGSFICTISQAG